MKEAPSIFIQQQPTQHSQQASQIQQFEEQKVKVQNIQDTVDVSITVEKQESNIVYAPPPQMQASQLEEVETSAKIEEANQVIRLDLSRVFTVLSQVVGDNKVFTQEYIVEQFIERADNEAQQAFIRLKEVDEELLYSKIDLLQSQLNNMEMVVCGLDAILTFKM